MLSVLHPCKSSHFFILLLRAQIISLKRPGASTHTYCTTTKIPFMCSQKRNCVASVPISTFMCLWEIYIFPGSVHIFSCSRIGRPVFGIYKPLTDPWMWKLGRSPRNSYSGTLCFEFSVLCLCSVYSASYCRFEVYGCGSAVASLWLQVCGCYILWF